jgi:excisionase family DNA binding protein
MEQEYFTPPEVAKHLRVNYTTVTRWIRNGALEAETVRQGRRNRHRIPKAVTDRIEQLGKHQSLV